jgi:hypothetical protein
VSEPPTPDRHRPMTELERSLAQALARCIFLPGSWDKRFAHDMAARSNVTEKQAANITRLAWRYRKQLPPGIRPTVQPRPFGAKPVARAG